MSYVIEYNIRHAVILSSFFFLNIVCFFLEAGIICSSLGFLGGHEEHCQILYFRYCLLLVVVIPLILFAFEYIQKELLR